MKYYHENAIISAIENDEFYYQSMNKSGNNYATSFVRASFIEISLKPYRTKYIYIKLPNLEYYLVGFNMISFYFKKSHRIKPLTVYENRKI